MPTTDVQRDASDLQPGSLVIRDVRLASDTAELYDVLCEDGRVVSILTPSPEESESRKSAPQNTGPSGVVGKGGLLLPS